MPLKSYLSRLLALVLVVAVALMGCAANPSGLTGNYRQDTLTVIESISEAIALPASSTEPPETYQLIRSQINDYIARYRRDTQVAGLRSFTTMQTALNGVAGFYASYGNRPLSDKLKKRVSQEFSDVELSLKRGV